MTRRLLFGYLAITLMVLGVLAIPLGVAYQKRAVDKLTGELVTSAYVEASKVQAGVVAGKIDTATADELRAYAEREALRAVVVDITGDALLDTNPLREGDDIGKNFFGRTEFKEVLQGQQISKGSRYSKSLDTNLVYAAVPVANEGKVVGALRLTYISDPIEADVRRYWLFLASMALISLAAVSLLGVLLARWLARPIDRLEDAAVALGAGELGSRVDDPKGPDELKALANSFNRTASRLQELVTSQDAFVADASHQLRTPLSGLRLRLENLVEEDVSEPAREELESAIAEVDRMARMVDGLLTLARADRSTADSVGPLDVRPVIDERVLTWLPFAEERSIALSASCPGATWALADPDRLTQALDNLVANALDAIPEGGSVTVWSVTRELDLPIVEVHVTDNGPGMTPHERTRAFDRFWRADPRRSGDFGGSGLGLPIVAKLVRADGGEVRLDESPGGGLDAVITLRAVDLLPPPDGERRRRALYR